MSEAVANIKQKLLAVQTKLKAPKSQRNNFGNYNYRNCEDILEALKPLLDEQRLTIVMSDTIEHIGDRYYLKATIELIDTESKEIYVATGYAREEETKKGMDGSQITGASSSYARKYALNGLFAIDDTKDSDATNTHSDTKETKKDNNQKKVTPEAKEQTKGLISEAQRKRLFAISNGNNDLIKEIISAYGYESTKDIKISDYQEICNVIESTVKQQTA